LTSLKIAVDSVDSSKIADGSITAVDIGNGEITSDKVSQSFMKLVQLLLLSLIDS